MAQRTDDYTYGIDGMIPNPFTPDEIRQSDQIATHAESKGQPIIHTALGIARCNQMRWDGVPCDWSKKITATTDQIQWRCKLAVRDHLIAEHRSLGRARINLLLRLMTPVMRDWSRGNGK